MKENVLIERVSELLSLNYNETCAITQKLFSEIAKYLIQGECFYIDDIGSFYMKYHFEEYINNNGEYIYIPPRIALEFLEENNPGDKRLSDIVVALPKNDYNLPRYFKVCINAIKSILLEDSKVYIEDFGTFVDGKKITFTPDIYISYLLNPFLNLEKRVVTKEEYESKKNRSIELSNDDLLNGDKIELDELLEGFDDKYIIEDLSELIEDNFLNKNLNQSDDGIIEELELIEEDILIDDIYNNTKENIKEDSIEDIIKKHVAPKKIFDIKEDLHTYNRNSQNTKKTYKVEVDDDFNKKILSKFSQEEEYKIIGEKIKRDKQKSFSFRKLFLILLAIFIISFAVGLSIRSITLTKTKIAYIKSVENLNSIVEDYFYFGDSIELSYITPRDMYFWDISKSLYDTSSYWPLVYALNERSFNADKIVKKGERIVYKNLNSIDINNTNPFKRSKLNSTLSKSYIALYSVFIKYGNINHANWVATMSAFYDEKVFEERKYLIPDELYTNISSKLK